MSLKKTFLIKEVGDDKGFGLGGMFSASGGNGGGDGPEQNQGWADIIGRQITINEVVPHGDVTVVFCELYDIELRVEIDEETDKIVGVEIQ